MRKYTRELGACYATETLQKAEIETNVVACYCDLLARFELSTIMLGYEVQQERERLSRRYRLAGMSNQINAIYLKSTGGDHKIAFSDTNFNLAAYLPIFPEHGRKREDAVSVRIDAAGLGVYYE
jgi:hypothetical protein